MDFNSNLSIDVLKELLTCGSNVYYWKYNIATDLITTNSPSLLLDKIFRESGTFSALLSNQGHFDSPVVLSGEYGIQWCASVEITPSSQKYIHVVGPSFPTLFSSTDLEEMIKNANIPLSSRTVLTEAINNIPVVNNSIFYQYCLMLHYCVTGKKCQRNQIISIAASPIESEYYLELKKNTKFSTSSSDGKSVARRKKTYEFEQRLLGNVVNGNMDYEKDMNMALSISDGVSLSPGTPLRGLQTSGVVFITLCTRAAITGGLSPDISYSLGDAFIDRIHHSRNAAEIKDILDEMYKAFISEVHFLKKNDGLSRQILDVVNYINNYPGEDLSLATLAGRIGYASEHLSRKFKAETGQTLSSYIREVRLNKAKELLSKSNLKISEIADQLGFASSSLFSTYFVEKEGISPSIYREKYYLK